MVSMETVFLLKCTCVSVLLIWLVVACVICAAQLSDLTTHPHCLLLEIFFCHCEHFSVAVRITELLKVAWFPSIVQIVYHSMHAGMHLGKVELALAVRDVSNC